MSDKIQTENIEQATQKTVECDKITLCKRKFMKELMLGRFWKLLDDVKLTPAEWKPIFRLNFNFLHYPNPQPKHVPDYEADSIRDLHRDNPVYSIGDLAWIFMRSKSTIHDVLNRKSDE